MGSNTSVLSRSPSSQSRNANNAGPNNLPPILFHSVHGENICLSRDAAVARRTDSFCKGIAFTNRPVKVNERIYLKFVETSSNWSGALRFGFTSTDPTHLRSAMPKYACPDITNKPGNWAKALGERLAQRDTLLFYYVNEAGHVYYGINGEEKGIFFDGVNTTQPLWGMLDIYGNTVAVELVGDRQLNPDTRQLNNATRPTESSTDSSGLAFRLSSLNIDQLDGELPIKAYKGVPFLPLPFHKVKGKNVFLSTNSNIAERNDSHYCQGYIFSSRPLRLEERYVVQVLKTERSYVGSLMFGLTSCDPTIISEDDLPDDSNCLMDRAEYWVLKKEVAESPQKGDELTFVIRQTGEVQYGKNSQPLKTIMHVDQSQMLWAFFDLYANTLKIKSIGVTNQSPVAQPRLQRSHTTDASSSAIVQDNSNSDGSNDNSNNECTLCFERPINCVLYSCGHMCMCYQCAQIQWKNTRGGFCPICRKSIMDVVRIYRT